ncbi:chemotaxis protein [Pseudomaricurvus alkylphenolicus]|jgi:hypothetical protein|uniref:chemotaxis protein n=1 Tax=Pseudomaricurvus alkylphenolicus TaxID=1306991 RepID=UPI00142363A9|nr:chemotaxis protein [Pseudomaricurvus alkylphenolicus]NIB42747.1 chemotaxis protein [Pseudomaricurvus alkylphenolicus]
MAKTETYVLAAKIAAHLHYATKVAEQLSLTAKNAHAVSARAGQQASGFRAITSFIEDLASTTITQASLISNNAVNISMLATNRERTNRALQHFLKVRRSAHDAAHIQSIDGPTAITQKQLRQLDEAFRDQLWQLELQLEETQQQIRAAAIISSTSKVEASQAGSFKPQLEVIATNIANAADQIKQHLQSAQQLLVEATDDLHHHY